MKVDEVPYDFIRKRLTVVVAHGTGARLITKGAYEKVLEVCEFERGLGGPVALNDERRRELHERFVAWSTEGFRVLGVGTKVLPERRGITRADESSLVFEGFLLFADPPKADVAHVVKDLQRLGVTLKVITGDQRDVAAHVARAIGLEVDPLDGVKTGDDLKHLNDAALGVAAQKATIFAEVDPTQKERVILALKRCGHVVGYLGDGINDAPALHAADVGISVDTAVDVAREAADFVLLRPDLGMLKTGIELGRATFANTLKYILTTESANFGNMLSMAAASLFLPFLPLLAPQVLLNNFLSDVPAMALASDAVDPEMVARPRRWDLAFVRRFMVYFGLASSVFDGLTFAALLGLHTSVAEFQTGWFTESLLSELWVALIVRTRRPFWRSRPGRALLVSSVAMTVVALGLPYSPLGPLFTLVPLRGTTWLMLLGISASYVGFVEWLKRRLLARVEAPSG